MGQTDRDSETACRWVVYACVGGYESGGKNNSGKKKNLKQNKKQQERLNVSNHVWSTSKGPY